MTSPAPVTDIELCLVMRHVWPVLAGASERFRRYAPGLRDRGISMTALARLPHPQMALDELAPGNVRVLRVPGDGDVEDWDRALFQRLLVHLREGQHPRLLLQTNVAHRHTRPLIGHLRQMGVPTVWLGSMIENLADDVPWWRDLRERLWLRWLLNTFDAFTVGSSVMRTWLRSAWIPQERIHVIGHGVNLERFHPVTSAEEKRSLRMGLGLPADAVVTLFVGTITERKGVHLLLEGWAKHLAADPRAVLVLAGGFDRPTVVHEEARQTLLNFQQQVRLRMEKMEGIGRFKHLGEVAEIEKLMQAADILVLPSSREGVPNVVLEGMACGLATLVTPFAGLPKEELGAEGLHFTVVAREADALGRALAALVNDAPRRQRIGAEAAAHAKRHFGLESTLDEYAKLYRALLPEG